MKRYFNTEGTCNPKEHYMVKLDDRLMQIRTMQTRDERRTDVIVDYLGEQFIIELKIWHGNEYNKRGERQLADYLNYYHKDRGYMLSFNFNKRKETGVKEMRVGDKIIIETVV